MGEKRLKWANVPSGHHNPLSYAVSARDQSVVQMVEDAVRHGHVMLAYQAVVPAGLKVPAQEELSPNGTCSVPQ